MINVVILSLNLLTNGSANVVYSVTADTTNNSPTGRVYLNTTSKANNWTNSVGTNQLVQMNSTNTFNVNCDKSGEFFRLNWQQSTHFSGLFTYTGSCPREVSFYCAGNLGRYVMTNGMTFNIAGAYGAFNGQLPCGQTVYVRDYASSEMLATMTFPYPCGLNEYELTGAWSGCR